MRDCLAAVFAPHCSFADTTKQSVHPHVATVTYLSDFGAPTMAVTQLPIAAGTSEFRHGFVSHPRLGKHMSFDGRYLHGVPPELMAARTPTTYTRITVLVNVWLSHALTEVSRWPDADVPTVSHAPLDAVNLEVTRVPFAAAVARFPPDGSFAACAVLRLPVRFVVFPSL